MNDRISEVAQPVQPGDQSGLNQSKAPERLVEFPTSTEETSAWLGIVRAGKNSSSSTDLSLPNLKLTHDETPETPPESKTGSIGSTDKLSETTDQPAKAGSIGFMDRLSESTPQVKNATDRTEPGNRDGDGIVDNPNGLSGAVLDQLAKLQKKEHSLKHTTEDIGEDTGAVAETANPQSYGFHDSVEKENAKLKAKNTKSESRSGELGVSEESGPQRTQLDNAPELMAGAMAGDVLAAKSALRQGVDLVSIYDLKVRKENDGRVILIAPSEKGSTSDGVAVVKEDGKPVSAMELGKYLRPDGTILLGDRGRALRPDEQFDQKFQVTDRSKFESEPESTEISLVSENKDQVPIVQATERTSAQSESRSSIREEDLVAASDLIPAVEGDHVAIAESDQTAGAEREHVADLIEGSELTSATGQTLTKEKFASARETNSESRLREQDSSDSVQTSEISFDPKESAQERRSIKTRLGETLRSIALRDLDGVKNWQLLAEKNNLSTATDTKGVPLATLTKGTVLVLPDASEIENFLARISSVAQIS
jgi:hypothetical protein